MLDDTEQLLVLVEAKISDFEKNIRKAERTGTRTYRDLNRGSQSATRAMERDMGRATRSINRDLSTTSTQIGKVGAAFKGFVAGAVVTAAGLAISRTEDMARSIAEIGDEAERAGVSARVFQEWRFVAEQNRIGIDSMIDGLKELNLRADEFVVTGKGPAAEAFQRLGYSASELETKLKDPSALLLEIIGRLGELDKAAQIRVSDEIFGGTAGERFVELIDQGVEGIGRTIDRAHDLGVVMDDEMIAKADEVNRRFNEISNTVGVKLKSAIVSAADSLADFLDGFRAFEDQRSSSLEGRVNEIIRERAQLYERLQYLESGRGFNLNRNFDIGITKGEIEELTREEDEIIAILQDRTTPQWKPRQNAWTPPDVPETASTGRSGGSGSRSGRARLDDLQREIKLIQERTQALNAETAVQANMNPLIEDFGYAVEKAAATHDLMNAALKAGVELTPELRAQIEALADAYGRAHVESEKLGQSQEETREKVEEMDQLRADTMRGFIRDLARGTDATDALNNALARVGDRLLEMSLESIFSTGNQTGTDNQSSGIGAVLGSVAKSILGFSSGTANTGGARGEPRGIVHGQEAVIPLPNGGKVPVQMMAPQSATGPQTVEVEVSISENGNLQAFVKKAASAEIGSMTPQLHRRIMGDAQRAAPGWIQDHNVRYG